MEYIEIDGEKVLIPADTVAAGRAAVAAWIEAELARRTDPGE